MTEIGGRLSRRDLIKRGTALALLGFPVAITAINFLRTALQEETEFNREGIPASVYQHLLSSRRLETSIPLIEKNSTPDLWRSSSVSLWSGDKTSGGALVEYLPDTFGIMTSMEAFSTLGTKAQVNAFIPGLEKSKVEEVLKNNPFATAGDSDNAAFKSLAFQKIDTSQAQQRSAVTLFPVSAIVTQAVLEAKQKGHLRPLHIANQAFSVGDRVGGARYNMGATTQYTVDSITGSTTIMWQDTFDGLFDDIAANREVASHFESGRLGDAIVKLDTKGNLTKQLIGIVGLTLVEKKYTNKKGETTRILITAQKAKMVPVV
ncbi:hypothetical protein BH11PAT1_BH11PAT1_7270 [soil metagenome]